MSCFPQVDGLRNPLVQSLFLEDCPIHSAAFAAGGTKVVAAGRRPFYYIADLHTAQLERVVTPPSVHHQGQQSGHSKKKKKSSTAGKGSAGSGGKAGMKSCESFAACSDPSRPLLAFLGDGGHIGLVSLNSRRPVGCLKMNGSARAATFSSDGNTLVSAGNRNNTPIAGWHGPAGPATLSLHMQHVGAQVLHTAQVLLLLLPGAHVHGHGQLGKAVAVCDVRVMCVCGCIHGVTTFS